MSRRPIGGGGGASGLTPLGANNTVATSTGAAVSWVALAGDVAGPVGTNTVTSLTGSAGSVGMNGNFIAWPASATTPQGFKQIVSGTNGAGQAFTLCRTQAGVGAASAGGDCSIILGLSTGAASSPLFRIKNETVAGGAASDYCRLYIDNTGRGAIEFPASALTIYCSGTTIGMAPNNAAANFFFEAAGIGIGGAGSYGGGTGGLAFFKKIGTNPTTTPVGGSLVYAEKNNGGIFARDTLGGSSNLSGGFFTQAMADAAQVISAANSINRFYRTTGANTVVRALTITLPPDSGTAVWVRNDCTVSGITVQFSSGAATGTILPSTSALVVGDGTNAFVMMTAT